jgi:hypothetical protein
MNETFKKKIDEKGNIRGNLEWVRTIEQK